MTCLTVHRPPTPLTTREEFFVEPLTTPSSDEKALSSCQRMLAIQLERSVNSVASSAFSAGLIDNQLLTSTI